MTRALALPLLVLSSVLLQPARLAAQVERQTPSNSFGTISATAGEIRALIEQAAPANLSRAEREAYQAHTDWLKRVVARLDSAALRIKSPRDMATGQASGQRQTVATVLSPDVDLLKQQIEEEGRKFAGLTNVLKTRHEAAMNSIRNMK